eukprot:COSAG02_NODE_5573_length_4221_cov_5.669335_2_plen_390_part_00
MAGPAAHALLVLNGAGWRAHPAGGSPYTQKMLAVLRFYRLPHRYITGEARQGLVASGIAPPRPQLAPTFYFKDEPMVDSTPIIARLEEGVGTRSLVPPTGAMAFLSRLIEDFGDEWVTKMMYHYRWDLDTDQQKASEFLMLSSNPALPARVLQERSKWIRERQTSRMDFVGSNVVTKPVIEGDFQRLVQLLDSHLAESGRAFLFGERPSVADYGLFGQLSQLYRVENTSRVVMESISMRVVVPHTHTHTHTHTSLAFDMMFTATRLATASFRRWVDRVHFVCDCSGLAFLSDRSKWPPRVSSLLCKKNNNSFALLFDVQWFGCAYARHGLYCCLEWMSNGTLSWHRLPMRCFMSWADTMPPSWWPTRKPWREARIGWSARVCSCISLSK